MTTIEAPYRENKIKKKWPGGCLRPIFLWLVLFGLEFDITIHGFITMRKLAFLAAIFYIVYKGMPRKIIFKYSFVIFTVNMLILFIYSFAVQKANLENIALQGNAGYSAIDIIFQYLYMVLIPCLLRVVFKNPDEFCKTQISILVFQSIIAILSRYSLPLRLFIYNRFVQDDGRMLQGIIEGVRVGIIGSIGATASWILFAGCIFCIYFMLKNKQEIRYLCYYFVIMIAMVFIGRTGLYFSVILLFLYYFNTLWKKPRMFAFISILGLASITLILAYILLTPEYYLKLRTIEWAGELLWKGFGKGSTIDAIRNMPVPMLTWETFWGTGLVGGTTVSGVLIQNDIGYIQTFCAIGLAGCLLYYLAIYGFFAGESLCLKDKVARAVLLLFLLFIMIAEYKEPFLRKTPMGMMFVTFAMLQFDQEHHDEKRELLL